MNLPFQPTTRTDIVAALSVIDAHDRDTWVRMAMAVKSELGEDGFSVWDSWSSNASNYQAKAALSTWKSIKLDGGVTVASLFNEARTNGWRPTTPYTPPTPEQQAVIEAERKAAAIEAELQKEQERARAKQEVNALWSKLNDVDPNHSYLIAKGIIPYGAKQVNDKVVLPLRLNSELVSLQYIEGSGMKTFHIGGQVKGSSMVIGSLDGANEALLCEGWATGCSLHEATAKPVVVAWNAYNLPVIAKYLNDKLPAMTVRICGDNDASGAGQKAAEAAAQHHGQSVWCVPDFTQCQPSQEDTKSPSDFNDLCRLMGVEEVRRQITRVNNYHQSSVSEIGAMSSHGEQLPIDYNTRLPDLSNVTHGKPFATIENLEEILKRLHIDVRYNVIKKESKITFHASSLTLENQENTSLSLIESECARFKYPTSKVHEFLHAIAGKNLFNPVESWILSRPWDGVERLCVLFETIKVSNENSHENLKKLKEILIKRWLISAVAAACNPNGVSAHGILVLQGAQGLGKTRWLKTLAPVSYDFVKDGYLLRPDNKDSIKGAIGYWIVELGELDGTFRKADIAQLKAFITASEDELRLPYAKGLSKYPRRTVFAASVNQREFLNDFTGNRRFWTISCEHITHDHGIDMQQLWSEVYERFYRKGEPYYLMSDELNLLNEHNQDFENIDPILERLQTTYDWNTDPREWREMTATDILGEIYFEQPRSGDARKCAEFVRKLNGHRFRKSNGKKVLSIPKKLSNL